MSNLPWALGGSLVGGPAVWGASPLDLGACSGIRPLISLTPFLSISCPLVQLHKYLLPATDPWASLDGSAGKESACNVGDLGSIPGLGRSPGEGKSYPLRYSGLENPVDWIVCGVSKSRTRLSD